MFNRLFFPQFDPLTGTLLAFATYAVGFIARPLGGVIFGHYGDRIGRKYVLAATLLLMGVATFLVGALPTYESLPTVRLRGLHVPARCCATGSPYGRRRDPARTEWRVAAHMSWHVCPSADLCAAAPVLTPAR